MSHKLLDALKADGYDPKLAELIVVKISALKNLPATLTLPAGLQGIHGSRTQEVLQDFVKPESLLTTIANLKDLNDMVELYNDTISYALRQDLLDKVIDGLQQLLDKLQHEDNAMALAAVLGDAAKVDPLVMAVNKKLQRLLRY